jgi:hypothetical protein
VLSPNGVVQLTRYTYTPQSTTVYNLEVYRTHTYLVGTMQAVVHNPDWGCWKKVDLGSTDLSKKTMEARSNYSNLLVDAILLQ